jgi:magnesium transporter
VPTLPSLRPPVRGAKAVPSLQKLSLPASEAVVDCAVYVCGIRQPGRWTHAGALAEVRRRGEGFVWVGLHAPDAGQMTSVAETFGLHDLAAEDAVHAHQRPKLERYDDTLFMVVKTVTYVAHESIDTAKEIVESGEIMVFVGADFVVTVRHGEHSALGTLRASLEADPEQLALGPAAVLHRIADHVVDSYLEVADAPSPRSGCRSSGSSPTGARWCPRRSVGTSATWTTTRRRWPSASRPTTRCSTPWSTQRWRR